MSTFPEIQQLDVKEIPVVGDSRVLVAGGLLDDVPRRLLEAGVRPAAFVIVSDKTVYGHYGARLMAAFARAGVPEDPDAEPKVMSFCFEPGESSKHRETKAAIEDFMFANRCTRNTVVVALGGGVVGDMAGFTAATYMRGVPVIQIPTSTTAIIDSSVGGKTAINVPAGKNLIGTFLQPKMIFADPQVLNTLSRRDTVEGLAEAIKMGVIRDAPLFKLMAAHPEEIISLKPEFVQEVLHKAVADKADVVAMDPHEKGIRSTLNYGHTIGHGIEALVSPKLLHGECVAIGCIWEAELACRMGHLPREAIPEIKACFEAYGLPVNAPPGLTVERIMDKMSLDKKNQGKTIRCTIITAIGASVDDALPVERELMQSVVTDMLAAASELKH